MEKKNLSEVAEEEIGLWEKRVFFPQEAFRENTPADLKLLKRKVVDATMNDKAMILASETEACIYKIGRYMVEIGVRNDDITFIDGDIFMPYVDINSKYRWQSRNLIDEVLESISKEIPRKWVIIPEINCEWTKELCLYFMMKIEKMRPYGIIFFSNSNYSGNLAEVLVESTYIDVLQFPMPRYSHKKEKVLVPDEY